MNIGAQCKAPDCARRVAAKSKTGLCKRHLHHKDICQCSLCKRVRALVKKPVLKRPAYRSVSVTENATTSNAWTTIAVSLPKEPWHE